MASKLLETDLYPPLKRYLEALGYEVKSEVVGCDVVAQKADEEPLIIELKTRFSLDLVIQGVDRQAVSDLVYLAVPAPDTPTKRKNWRGKVKGVRSLCRRLGLGLILVALDKSPQRQVEVMLDPAPYQPRKNKRRQGRLQKEFSTRSGDPNQGGQTRSKIMTAYRQDAVRLAEILAVEPEGQMRAAELKKRTQIERAASILQKNHYGWFERVSRGVYGLTELGKSIIHDPK